MKDSKTTSKSDRNFKLRAAYVCAGILINVLLSFLCDLFKIPLYLDTVGTITSAALGGFFPGVITAVASNLLCGFFNGYSVYYSIINILIAVVTVYFFKNNKFKKKTDYAIYVIYLTLISGVLGIIFQWTLLGDTQFKDVSDVAHVITERTGIAYFITTLVVNVLINLVDKSLAAAAGLTIYHFIPENYKNIVKFGAWAQKPLDKEELAVMKKRLKEDGTASVRSRITGMLVIASISMAFVMAAIGLKLYYTNMRKEYHNNAMVAARFAAETVDGDKVNEYLKSGAKISEYNGYKYKETNKQLKFIKDSVPGIKYVYVYQIRSDGCYTVFDTDDEVQATGSIGDFLEFEEDFGDHIPSLLAGEEVEVVENSGIYGYFYTAYEPIYDSNGNCVAYAGADASLDYMHGFMRDFIIRVLFIFSGFFVLILSYGLFVSGYFLIYPINSMASSANEFVNEGDDQETIDRHVRKLKEINIRTGDEVEKLYDAICRMAESTADQMRDIRHFADATSKMQTGLIITMADMVENRDSDTGAHIQKTAAYVKIICEGLRKKGYYTEKLTDKYIADVVMSAPLHDVGKINIPDAVLNKPGKLDPDEYEIMKTHTTAGKIIMERAIKTVEGENYLKEARNMAAYHHERWDGKGYPEGLVKEVIPLSARVMAVADVFDALTSPRVYKPAFPLEKALQIITEGAGQQFDPKCVEVFMESLDEVKAVLKKYQEG